MFENIGASILAAIVTFAGLHFTFQRDNNNRINDKIDRKADKTDLEKHAAAEGLINKDMWDAIHTKAEKCDLQRMEDKLLDEIGAVKDGNKQILDYLLNNKSK